MPVPNVNPSPKERFLSNREFVTKHHDLIQLPEFQRALDYALLQMSRELAIRETPDAQDAMGAHYEIKGANDFIKTLKRLAESDIPQTKTVDRDNLATQR